VSSPVGDVRTGAPGGRRPLLAVLDYGIGNLRSAEKAFRRAGGDAVLTADPAVVDAADAVVLPGVGAFGRCREALAATGLDEVALAAIDSGRPFIGICVGMQLLFESSEESPGVAGLGVLSGGVRRLPDGVKRPQMQWNQVDVLEPSPLWDGLGDRPWMYFVHSFAADRTDDTVATCDYGGPVVAAVRRGNVVATQFHPEKSGRAGLTLLANLVRLVAGAPAGAA
jgi:imidazole glycerol-phosphate synthase subunit HisH